jgi:ABC-type molybdenum transport system ATPase subunit/photorepair protein PhrA
MEFAVEAQKLLEISLEGICRTFKTFIKQDVYVINKNLHASIDGKEILKGINLEVKAGEIHAIMGPNGAGKVHLFPSLQERNLLK